MNDEITQCMSQLFETVNTADSSSDASYTTFAQDLDQMIQLIIDGECICLHGISSKSLRLVLEKLFQVLGLIQTEMEDEDDDATESNMMNREERYGYALPDESDVSPSKMQMIQSNLQTASVCCKQRYHPKASSVAVSNQNTAPPMSNLAMEQTTKKRIIGPSRPDLGNTDSNTRAFAQSKVPLNEKYEQEDDDDAILGPVLPWTAEGIRRMKNRPNPGQPISTNTLQGAKPQSSGREEWMTEAPEHSFLNDIMGSLKSRSFKNEKASRLTNKASDPEPVDPKVQHELNRIKQSYSSSRGPSLMEMHQEKKKQAQQQTELKPQGGEWKWDREKDLEKGRKIDKEYLKMVMGGASTDLKTKFQGDFTKSFT